MFKRVKNTGFYKKWCNFLKNKKNNLKKIWRFKKTQDQKTYKVEDL